MSLPDWPLLTVEELGVLTPESRLEVLEAALEFLHDHAKLTDPLDLAAELRGFVLGFTKSLR